MKDIEFYYRLDALLRRPEGATFDELGELFDFDQDRYRQQRKRINDRLKLQRLPAIEKVPGRKGAYRLNTAVSLPDLMANSRELPAYFNQLANILTSSENFLGDEAMKRMNVSFRSNPANERDCVISFENNTCLYETDVLPMLFNAIRARQPLSMEVCDYGAEKTKVVEIHPEFLKQYNAKWYLFGMLRQNGAVELCHGRVELGRIVNGSIQKLPLSTSPFVDSGVNYEDYFYGIFGIENYEGRKVQTVEFIVSSGLAKRFEEHPLHDSEKRRKVLDREIGGRPFFGFSIEVKRNLELKRILLSYGRDLVVLSPKELRDEIRKEHRRAAEIG